MCEYAGDFVLRWGNNVTLIEGGVVLAGGRFLQKGTIGRSRQAEGVHSVFLFLRHSADIFW